MPNVIISFQVQKYKWNSVPECIVYSSCADEMWEYGGTSKTETTVIE